MSLLLLVKQEVQIWMVVYTSGKLSPRCIYNMYCRGAGLGVFWIIGRQSLGFVHRLSSFLAEILEGSCVHFHLYFVQKYIKKPDTTAKCMQMLPKSPGLTLADCHMGLFKLLIRIDNAQFKIPSKWAFDARTKTHVPS